jgi:hypothetical protein
MGLFNIIQQASPQVVVLRHPKGHNFKLNMEHVKPFHKKWKIEEEKQQPTPASTGEDYKVKAIVDHCDQKDGCEYKVHWVRYTTQDNSWVPAANVQANHLIQDYLNSCKL